MRLALSKALAGCLAVLSVTALSACGGTSNDSTGGGAASDSTGSAGKVVDIYSSLPLRGPAAAEAVPLANGIKLALSQSGGKAGPFTVQYTRLDDSTADGGWDASQTASNARKAAADPRAVYYIGEFDDDASEVSMPILNQAGIAQVSPGQHVRRAHHERAGHRLRRAALRADRRAYLPTDRADRHGPGCRRLAGDAPGRLYQGGDRERRRGVRRRLRPADPAPEGVLRDRHRQRRPDQSQRQELSPVRGDAEGPARRLLPARRCGLQERRGGDQGRPCSAADGQDLRSSGHVLRRLDEPQGRWRAGHRRPADRVHSSHPEPVSLPGVPGRSWPPTGPRTRARIRARTRSSATRR